LQEVEALLAKLRQLEDLNRGEASARGEHYVAAFVGEGAQTRLPARQACSSPAEAREWIAQEAAELDLPVSWLDEPGV
jgi:hypothetical protein